MSGMAFFSAATAPAGVRAPEPRVAHPAERVTIPVELQLAAPDGREPAGDVYQVVAIDAGVGNGWEFSPSVMKPRRPSFSG
jgi:hypothetical protein